MANNIEIRVQTTGAEQASKVLAAIAKEGGAIGSIMSPAVKKAEDSLNSLGATARRVFEIFAGVNLAHAFEQAAGAIKGFVTESAKLGLEAKVQEDAFAQLTKQVGVSGDALVAQMQKAAGGILNTSDVMIAASKALLEGLQPEQIIKLMEIARQQSKLTGTTVAETFNSMATAIGNQQEKGLKAIRINIDATTALEKYAAQIGTTATNLTDMQKTQAFYLATVEKTKPVVEALTTAQLAQKEVLEKAASGWKQFKEDLGKFEVDAGFAILKWLMDVKTGLGDLTPILAGVGRVWAATWATATVNFGAFKTDVTGLKGLIKDIGLAFAQLGFGISTVFMVTAGAAAGIGSLLEDLGNRKLPDIGKAMETAVAKQKEAFASWNDARTALQALAAGTTAVSDGQKKMGESTPLGTNNLGAQVDTIKASLPAFDALEKAMRALSDKALAQQLSEDDAKLLSLTQGVRNAVAETKNLGPAARDALLAYADGVAQGIVAGEEMIAQLKEINALVHAGSIEKPTQSPIGAQIQDLDVASRRFTLLADAERLATDQISATEKAIDALLTDGFDPMDEGLQTLVTELHEYRDALLEAQRVTGIGVSVTEAFKKTIEETRDPVAVLVDELHAAQNEAKSFAGGMTSTAGEISATEKAIKALASEFGDLDPTVVQLRSDLADLKSLSFDETIADINAQAAFLGPTFDNVGKRISATEQELSRLVKESRGEWTPAISELQGQLNGLMGEDFIQKLRQGLGLTRTVFDDLVDAGRGTASALNGGFSDGFFALFTGQVNTLGEVFANFGKSMLRVLTDFLASQAVKGLFSLFEWLIGGMSGSLSGGGLIGSIFAAGAALLAKVFGRSSSSGIGPGTGTDPTGPALDAVTTSASGAATALDKVVPGVNNFSAAVSAGLSAIGVGLGIFGLAKGGSAGSMALSAGGTALSAYSLIQGVSVLAKSAGLISTSLPTIGIALAEGFAALAPGLALSIGTSLSGILPPAIVSALGALPAGTAIAATGTASVAGSAVSSVLASLTPFLELLSGIAAPLAIFGAFVSMGFAGMAQDAEDAADAFTAQTDAVQNAMNGAAKATAIFSDLGTQLDEGHLVGTLHTLHDAMRDLGNLDLAAGLNQVLGDEAADSITKAIPTMRATVGAAWLVALDAAFKQGIVLTPGAANAPNTIGETLQSPMRLGRGGLATTQEFLGLQTVSGPDATAAAITMLAHVLEITSQQAAAFIPMWNDWVSGDGGAPAMGARIGDAFWNSVISPEHMAQLQASGIISATNEGSPNSNKLDIDAINRLLDGELLTTTLRNAVVDIGAMFGIGKGQLGAVGAGEGNWRGTPGAGDMPSVSAIAGVQAALEAAGFVPGEYAKALEAYLVSIDANIVQNPLWKKFIDSLHGGAGGVGEIQTAMNAAIVATMTPLAFYDAAKAITDTLTANITAAMAQQAAMVTAGASQDEINAVGTLIESMQAGIKAYAGLVQLFTGLPGEMAALTGDLEAQTDAAIAAWQVTVKALGDNVQAAQQAFDEALTGGNIIAIQQTAQALHDSAMGRYQAELKMLESLEAAAQQTRDAMATLVQQITQIAVLNLSAGSGFGAINGLLDSLAGMARTASTATARLWAVDQGIQAIIAVLPDAIRLFGSMQNAMDWLASGIQTMEQLRASGPAQITGAVISSAAPFLGAQQSEIDAATGGAKLALLQQQAAAWTALANAAINGINQWAQQAIKGAQEAAQSVLDGIGAQRDAQLAAIDAQIEGIQDAARAEQESRQAQMEALQEQIAKAREFKAAVESMSTFLRQLKLGTTAPINPRDQLTIAKDAFNRGLAQFNARPSAQGLTDLQSLTQAFLQADEKVFSKPSPQYQQLFTTLVQQLEAAQALADGLATDSEVLQSQLDALQAIDKTAARAAQDQLDALNATKASITRDFDRQTRAIQDASRDQVQAIQDAATAEVDAINAGLATALTGNAEEQKKIAQSQLTAQEAIRDAVTRGTGQGLIDGVAYLAIRQDAAIAVLESIRNGISLAVGQPLAMGSERVKEGLFHLHNDEAVLTAAQANKLRSAGGLGALEHIRSAAAGAGLANSGEVGSAGVDMWTAQRGWTTANAAYNAAVQGWQVRREQIESDFAGRLRALGKHPDYGAPAALEAQHQAALTAWQGSMPIPPPLVAPPGGPAGVAPPPSSTPPAGSPVTPPPVPPPYVPAGPGWLNSDAGSSAAGAGGAGGGALTVVVQLDGKTIGQAVLPTVLADARAGAIYDVIVKTKTR